MNCPVCHGAMNHMSCPAGHTHEQMLAYRANGDKVSVREIEEAAVTSKLMDGTFGPAEPRPKVIRIGERDFPVMVPEDWYVLATKMGIWGKDGDL